MVQDAAPRLTVEDCCVLILKNGESVSEGDVAGEEEVLEANHVFFLARELGLEATQHDFEHSGIEP